MGVLTATAPEPADAGHLIPDDAWEAIVAGALLRAAELERPQVGLAAVDRTIPARSHGGAMAGGPRLGVIHSAETPLAAGYAYSIAANWFATKATTSATVMIDPAETIRLLPDDVVAYHVGPRGNGFTVGVEQAGYASIPRAEWLSPAGRAQMRRVADYMVECWRRWQIPPRWATDEQIRAAALGGYPQGWCTHDDVRRVLGGTTHTDPGGNYPRAELMALVIGLTAGEDPGDMPLTAQDEAQITQYGGLIEAAAVRAAARVATAANPWGLDALRRRIESLQNGQAALAKAVASADANDSADAIVEAIVPVLGQAVAEAVQQAVEAGGVSDVAQLRDVVDAALRGVLADAATA